MRSSYLMDRLMGRDSRRGGGRDRDYRGYDSNYDDEYDSRRRDYAHEERRRSEDGRGYEYGRQHLDGRRSSGRRDMNYDDYDSRRDFEYNYDMHDKELELNEKQIKEWEHELKNADGSKGAKFSKEQIIPIAKQFGIEFKEDKFTEEEFVMVVNMMYSDYCKALQESSFPAHSKPEVYINLAKAFLCDEDFEGKPYEKLALYYYDIVEYDE